jgi:hypothetical protein
MRFFINEYHVPFFPKSLLTSYKLSIFSATNAWNDSHIPAPIPSTWIIVTATANPINSPNFPCLLSHFPFGHFLKVLLCHACFFGTFCRLCVLFLCWCAFLCNEKVLLDWILPFWIFLSVNVKFFELSFWFFDVILWGLPGFFCGEMQNRVWVTYRRIKDLKMLNF